MHDCFTTGGLSQAVPAEFGYYGVMHDSQDPSAFVI
jgi:hypothetical protein